MTRLEVDAKSGLPVVPLWIDGKPAASTPSKRFVVRSADQEKDVFLAEAANKASAIEAADVAWRTFKTWKKVSAATRRDILLRFCEILKSREEDLVAAQRDETSVSELWARKNVSLAAEIIEEVASKITSISGFIPQSASSDCLPLVFSEPVGSVLAIAP
jgi:acyl-CoA reductase-like NAD-dependent aldehyde dehydrogenase